MQFRSLFWVKLSGLIVVGMACSPVSGASVNDIAFTGDDPQGWAKQIQAHLVETRKMQAGAVSTRLVAATFAQKMSRDDAGKVQMSSKMVNRPFDILPQFLELEQAVRKSPWPDEFKELFLAHVGGRYLFPIRQSPPDLGGPTLIALIGSVPGGGAMVTTAADKTVADLLQAHWPDYGKLTALQQQLVYRGLARFNPLVEEQGWVAVSDGSEGAARITMPLDLEEQQMDRYLYAVDPTLRRYPPLQAGQANGDAVSYRIDAGRLRTTRFFVPAGGKLYLPPASYLAQLADPKHLDLRDAGLSDLSVLAGLTPDFLDLAGCPVADLAPLANMSSLRGLRIDYTQVSDLAPLAALPLTHLDMRGTKVSQLGPLASLPLTRLDISESPVSDLSPVAEMPLQWLALESTPVKDLSPLSGLDDDAYLFLDLWGDYEHLAKIGSQQINDAPKAAWIADYERIKNPAAAQAAGDSKKKKKKSGPAPRKVDTRKSKAKDDIELDKMLK